jgi:hypothetical protein
MTYHVPADGAANVHVSVFPDAHERQLYVDVVGGEPKRT